jgi:O-antigen/teichoic acid export membrane protein
MDDVASLTRNTLFAIIAGLLSRLGNTLLFIAIVNVAGVEGGGVYNLALAIFFIASRFAFWGLDHLLTREVAADLALGERYLGNFLFARGLLALAAVASFAAIVLIIGYDPATELVILLMLLSVLPENINNLCWSAFAAHEEYHLASAGSVVNLIFKLGLGLLLIALGAELTAVVLAVLFGNTAAMVVNLALVRRRYMPGGWRRPDLGFLREQLRIAFPFVFVGVFFILDNRLDNVLLSLLSSEREIGIYGAALAVINALGLIPEGFRIAVLPVMARHRRRAESSLQNLYSQSYRLLLAASLPLAVASFIMAPGIIGLLYKAELHDSVIALRILAVSVVFIFLNVLNSRLLVLYNQQGLIARFLLLTAALNGLLNLLLITEYGAKAAAFSRTVSVLALFALSTWASRHFVDEVGWTRYWWRLGTSCVVMGLVVWQLTPWGVWLQAALGGITYVMMLLSTRFVSPDEIRLIRQLAVRRATKTE